MTTTPSFQDLVRHQFAGEAERHGMREVFADDLPVLKRVIYANADRAVSFSLDVVDGYSDAKFGPSSVLDSSGRPHWPQSECFQSIRKLLREEIPIGPAIYRENRLPEIVRALVAGIVQNEASVFGVANGWDADGA